MYGIPCHLLSDSSDYSEELDNPISEKCLQRKFSLQFGAFGKVYTWYCTSSAHLYFLKLWWLSEITIASLYHLLLFRAWKRERVVSTNPKLFPWSLPNFLSSFQYIESRGIQVPQLYCVLMMHNKFSHCINVCTVCSNLFFSETKWLICTIFFKLRGFPYLSLRGHSKM